LLLLFCRQKQLSLASAFSPVANVQTNTSYITHLQASNAPNSEVAIQIFVSSGDYIITMSVS